MLVDLQGLAGGISQVQKHCNTRVHFCSKRESVFRVSITPASPAMIIINNSLELSIAKQVCLCVLVIVSHNQSAGKGMEG